jgi:phosphomannomutase
VTLIASISGIRGTIGGKPGGGLTPPDIVRFTTAYASWLIKHQKSEQPAALATYKVVIGRDARLSGRMVSDLVSGTLAGCGIDVIDLGLSTTPTVEMAVTEFQANGGIIITASHNPKHWNALKLLNQKGEFIDAADGEEILKYSEKTDHSFATVEKVGSVTTDDKFLDAHIDKIIALPYVDVDAVRKANLTVAVDAVNSSGGVAVPRLLKKLGVEHIKLIHGIPNGDFAHNPEPLPENLMELCSLVKDEKAHVGISVDPDVDRVAFVCETGEMFGEEYTLVAVADYVLKQHPGGNTVSNLSSTRALKDVTEAAGGKYAAAAVGEVNVVKLMKDSKAVIGGEGNGGVIVPSLHYGRDALAGIAIFLTHLAKSGKKLSELKASYPAYEISKNKIELRGNVDMDSILKEIGRKYKDNPLNTVDGLRIEFGNDWVHLRKSNTEPVIRIYSESQTAEKAEHLASKIMRDIRTLSGG